MKPSPDDIIDRYFESLRRLGIQPEEHDLRLVEDDWESPTLGASGVGWQVWMDGEEITQFTYFQQVGGVECRPVCAEITYGPERISAHIQKAESMWDIRWGDWEFEKHKVEAAYKDLDLAAEIGNSHYSLSYADSAALFRLFEIYESEAQRLVALHEESPERLLVYPAYDCALKCSHLFNLLDARGAIAVSQRVQFIARIRNLAKAAATAYVRSLEATREAA